MKGCHYDRKTKPKSGKRWPFLCGGLYNGQKAGAITEGSGAGCSGGKDKPGVDHHLANLKGR